MYVYRSQYLFFLFIVTQKTAAEVFVHYKIYFKETNKMANEILDGKVYTIKNVGTQKMLNLYGGLLTNGTNVCQYSADGSSEQKWARFGNYLHTFGSTTKVLDRYNDSSSTKHNNADIWGNNDPGNQVLDFDEESNGYAVIKMNNADLYLTAYPLTGDDDYINNNGNKDISKTTTSKGNVYWGTLKDNNYARWIVTEKGEAYKVFNTFLPLKNWYEGKYWTVDGTGTGASKSFEGAYECAGFAKYVYSQIWGSSTYGSPITARNKLYGNSSDFSGINVGARINCDRKNAPKGKDPNHSMVIVDKNSLGITVYEANYTRYPSTQHCIIGFRTISYSNFAAEYLNIKNSSYNPD